MANWPLESLAETVGCRICQVLVGRALVVEMIDEAVAKYDTAVDDEAIGRGHSGFERRGPAAQVVARSARRECF